MIDCHFDLRFVFNKDLHGATPGLSAQETLLMPFTKLQGCYQKCVVKGADPELVKRVTKLLTPSVHWRRARRWELMDLLMLKQSLAIDKFCTGDFWAIALEILEAFELACAFGKAHIVAMKSDDRDLYHNFARWYATSIINQCICEIHNSLSALHGAPERYHFVFMEQRRRQALAHLTPRELAIWNSLLGIAYLAIEDHPNSIKHFRDACAIDASVEAYGYCLLQLQNLQKRSERGRTRKDLERIVMLDLIDKLDFTLFCNARSYLHSSV